MFRSTTTFLATVSTGKSSAGGGTRRKSKWIDRRYKTPAHGGKEVFQIGSHPSCELCQVRFRFKQDYMTHTESELHKSRLKWKETMAWWATQGKPSLVRHQAEEWETYLESVIKPASIQLGVPVDSLVRGAHSSASIAEAEASGIDLTAIPVPQTYVRYARVSDCAAHHAPIQPPATKAQIPEPKDNRWPYAPKW